MEKRELSAAPPASRYTLKQCLLKSEDILFCIDRDVESSTEMKASGPNGQPITRMDAIKQALLLFVNSKHTINPDHRFSFSYLDKSFSWPQKEFSNDVDFATAAIRSLAANNTAYGLADLTLLLKAASDEGNKYQGLNRLLRVVLIYCRSSIQPVHKWPVSNKCFTMDIIYLHDKPSPENCPQKVFDSLVDTLEHVTKHEGYILESGQGLVRVLFRHVSILLSHPQQRCPQDELDIPRPLARKSPPPSTEPPSDESGPASTSR